MDGYTPEWQWTHSDWDEYDTSSMKWGFALSISVACSDIPVNHGPIAVFPWSNRRYRKTPYPQYDRYNQQFCVTMLEGEILIRDVRAAHCGTANMYSMPRALPGFQIENALWYRGGD